MAASIVAPSRASTIGTPSMIRLALSDRHDSHVSTLTQNPKVETAITEPVREKSSCVTPCCTMSPTVTSSSSSNGARSARARFFRPRVSRNRKAKMTEARTTISTRGAPSS